MAIKKVVQIGADVKQAVGEIKDLFNELLEAERQAGSLNEELDKTGNDGSQAMKKVSDSTEESSSKFKGLGTAIKATGIGLLISLVASLTSILAKNQKIVDLGRTAFTALEIAVNKTTTAIGKATDSLKNFIKEGAKTETTIKDLANALAKDFIFRINKATESLYYMGKAFQDLFTDGIVKAGETAKKSLTSLTDAMTGVEDSASKMYDAVKEVIDEASNLTDLQNRAKISQALLRQEIEKYDTLAEVQRQIRDNENLSISERIKANNALGVVLEKQYKSQMALAQVGVASAQAEFNLSQTIENRVALIDAQTELLATQAQIEGFRSEQLVNQQSLIRENLELTQAQQEQDAKTALFNEKVNKQYENDSIKRLENERELIELELNLEEERLDKKAQMYADGTQARQDAENELVAFREEKELEIAEKEKEILRAKEEREREVLTRLMDNESLSFTERYNAIDEYLRAVVEATQLSEYEQNKLIEDATDKRIELAKKEKQAKIDMFNAITQAGDAMAQAVGEQTALGKTLAVASALISTYQGIANEIGTKTITPYEIAFKIANIATVAAVGFKSVKDILSVKVPNSGSSGGSAPQAQAPNFNIVGQSSTNQLAETIGQQEQEPVKAYVVATEMTTQQALQRNIREKASFG